jgi:hypothetical protein
MITEAFFNHICRVCLQTRRIYRFFANGIIIFSTATLYAVGFKAENPDSWGGTPALFSFYRFFSHTTSEILCNVTIVSQNCCFLLKPTDFEPNFCISAALTRV